MGSLEAWAASLGLAASGVVVVPALLVGAAPGRLRVLRALGRGAALTSGVALGGVGAAAVWTRNAEAEYAALSENGLPLTYDPEGIAAFWSAHRKIALRRVGVIATRVVPFAAGMAVERLTVSDEEKEAVQAARARGLRELLTELGPTFIKFGQMLSIRPDVVPPVALAELQKLCDAVPSYPTAEALALIEEELGAPAATLFDGLDSSTDFVHLPLEFMGKIGTITSCSDASPSPTMLILMSCIILRTIF